jgi:DNA-binding response OmpR family regulator
MDESSAKRGEEMTSVLVVEDELFIAMELEGALTAAGFRVIGPAASVDVALDMLEEERPSFAVLDFNLGREKVVPVALQLKLLGVPFVLASASGPNELARYSVFTGVDNLGKPTDYDRLVATISSLQA